MIEINGKHLCENCFEQTDAAVCPHCGYDPANNANDPALLPPGSTLLDKYIIGKIIGKGGFGTTYLAFDTSACRKVAIKEYFPYEIAMRSAGSHTVSVISPDNKSVFEMGADKFYEEAKLISQFNGNPNIVSVYELFSENGTVYFSMEYLRGRTLKQYIRDNGSLTAPKALYVAECVSNALAAAHGASVLHRDISPDNIIICRDGNVKLIDFGAARQLASEQSQSFSIILKPGFAPLEQYNRKGNQGPWTDIYSLGASLYFSLTGDIPEDPMARYDDNDDTFKENIFDIDQGLWNIIIKATALKVDNRYSNIREMQKDLSELSFPPEPITIATDPAYEEDLLYRSAVPNEAASATSIQAAKQSVVFDENSGSAKKGAFEKHKRAIIGAAGGIAAACVAAAIAISANSGRGSSSVPDDPTSNFSQSGDQSDPAKVTVADPLGGYEDKIYYKTLDDKSKTLYKIIYEGMTNSETEIRFNYGEYEYGLTNVTYYKVLYDNPQFCHIQNFYYSYSEENDNGTTDDNEFVTALRPFYITDASDIPQNRVAEVISECDPNADVIENLAYLHDHLIKNTNIVKRYANASCTSAWGAVVAGKADDVGFAKGFCYYAQALGINCYVVDGQYNGEPRSWCRLKLGDTWYNVDVYGDKLAGGAVTKLKADDSGCYRTYFLTSDKFIEECGYVPNPEYLPLWEGEYAANSSDKNLFLQQDGGYFFDSAEDAYDLILSYTADNFPESGSYSFEVCVAPFAADGLYDRMNADYLADLKKKYNITASGYSLTYKPDTAIVTLTK